MKNDSIDGIQIGKIQSYLLVVLRVVIGWHILYEGLVKVTNPNWSSAYYLNQSTWIFSDLFKAIADNPTLLSTVDFLNQWLLFLLGLFLILGLFSRVSSFAAAMLLLLYYIAQPPLFDASLIQSEGSNLIVNKLFIEIVALICLALLPTGRFVGFDRIIHLKKMEK